MSLLLEKLKAKRKQIAEREGKELFLIFHNKTLEETARVKPKTLKDLEKVKGWGRKKIANHGKEILEVINSEKTEVVKEETKPEFFTVNQFIGLMNTALGRLGSVRVAGEISDVELRRGMAFFTLKDSSGGEGVLRCFVAAWDFDYISHLLENGLEAIIRGTPSVYLKSGALRLLVKTIEPIGEGALKRAFEALKKKLEAKGYFALDRKRKVPVFIKQIGLITSEAGEAVNDFKKNIGPHGFRINFFDVQVEGDYAEASILKALHWFNKNEPAPDVLVLIRGGGSLENLKVFNSEKIAEAIAASKIPVLTGIGHEGDETIAGLTADKNFSTPTAVAVFLRQGREDLILRTEVLKQSLNAALLKKFETTNYQLSRFSDKLIFACDRRLQERKFATLHLSEKLGEKAGVIFQKFQKMETAIIKFLYYSESAIQSKKHQLKILSRELSGLSEKIIKTAMEKIRMFESIILNLNPEAVLRRGYALVRGKDGKIVKESKKLNKGDSLEVRLYQGRLGAEVLWTEE